MMHLMRLDNQASVWKCLAPYLQVRNLRASPSFHGLHYCLTPE